MSSALSPERAATTLVVTGTGTDVGKTVATAALVALARARGLRTAAYKPVQTGLAAGTPGDADEVARLAAADETAEARRLSDPLAPETAARVAGEPQPTLDELLSPLPALRERNDLVVVEGAGGALVRLGTDLTVLDLAARLRAPVVVVTRAGLGTLSDTELTVRELTRCGLRCVGLLVGALPGTPDLATRCNLEDLPRLTGAPLLGAVPTGAGALEPEEFRRAAPGWFAPDAATKLRLPSY